MVRKYFLQQLGLLIMVSVIMVLTNILGYKMPVGDSSKHITGAAHDHNTFSLLRVDLT